MEQKVLGNLKRGLFFILSAPAGTGKTTLVNRLTHEFSCVVRNVSFTTRPIRGEEVYDQDYHFIAEDMFQKKLKNNDFLEYAKVFDYYYGSDKNEVFSLQNQGKHVFLVIDTQGAMHIKKTMPGIFIFLMPPSLEVLHSRLRMRETETKEERVLRLSHAEQEMLVAENYDYIITNDNIDVAYEVLRSIVIAAEHKANLQLKDKKS